MVTISFINNDGLTYKLTCSDKVHIIIIHCLNYIVCTYTYNNYMYRNTTVVNRSLHGSKLIVLKSVHASVHVLHLTAFVYTFLTR
jgi:hypothetical protein